MFEGVRKAPAITYNGSTVLGQPAISTPSQLLAPLCLSQKHVTTTLYPAKLR